jgi:hypothetical protein
VSSAASSAGNTDRSPNSAATTPSGVAGASASRSRIWPASGSSSGNCRPSSAVPCTNRIQAATTSAPHRGVAPAARRAAMVCSTRCGSFCEPSIATCTVRCAIAGLAKRSSASSP